MSQLPTTSLLDLPNELLLVVSQDLDDDGLLHLASTCQRLNLLMIPLVFARYDFELPSSSIPSISLTAKNLRVLAALEIASFVTSIDDIDLSLEGYYHLTYSDLLISIRRLHAVATRLSHLGHVRLGAIDINSWKREGVRHWPHTLAALLNTVSQRGTSITLYAGMEDVKDPRPFLHVVASVPLIRNTAPHPVALVKTRAQRLRTILDRLFRPGNARVVGEETPISLPRSHEPPTIQSSERPSPITLPLVTGSALSTFNIHASFPFHITFYKWTLHALNASPLRTLSLDNIDLLHYDWTLALPALTLPTLETLAVLRCAIGVPDLTRFLARHPSILSLDLSYHVAIGALVPYAPRGILPRLASIYGPPNYLLYFLAPEHATYADLRAVGIRSDAAAPYDVAQFAQLVARLQRRRVVPRVDLDGLLARHCQLPADLAGQNEGE